MKKKEGNRTKKINHAREIPKGTTLAMLIKPATLFKGIY